MRLQEYLALAGLIIVLLIASLTRADYIYDYTAVLGEDNYFIQDNETFYYDIFEIQSELNTIVTFENYDANLGDYDDPYLYLYILENNSFNGINSLNQSYVLYDEDDDGNYSVNEGLYFYLEDVTFDNHLIAMVTSYDPEQTGTVDFKIYSNNELSVIPEPQAVGLILLGGASLLLFRKR
jgi:hypothetical protein|tara:strand:- start:8339 stop:8878 length:540 start_codon:yes stop_codon:yes gene_type:complete